MPNLFFLGRSSIGLVVAAALAATLAGCGVKGPLKLPQPAPPPQGTLPSEPPAPAPPIPSDPQTERKQ